MLKILNPSAVTIPGVWVVFANYVTDVGWTVELLSHEDPSDPDNVNFEKLENVVKELGLHNVTLRYYDLPGVWDDRPGNLIDMGVST